MVEWRQKSIGLTPVTGTHTRQIGCCLRYTFNKGPEKECYSRSSLCPHIHKVAGYVLCAVMVSYRAHIIDRSQSLEFSFWDLILGYSNYKTLNKTNETLFI